MLDERKMSHKSEKKRSRSGSEKLHKVKSLDKMIKKQQKRVMKKLRRKAAAACPNFSYQLFLYRQELRRSSADFSYLRLSKAKILLTSELINRNIGAGNPMSSIEELKELSREVQFKKRLCHQVERLQQFRQLGLTEMILNGKKMTL
ncbi:hypothetical protein KR018_000949 [Drosophila ironensis]|nr:hypothetical protein KR018_000949 [Drosophila ironensis]